MKNTKSLFVLAFASLLFSCGGEKKISYELSWLSPTGSPTLAFYSEAENSNWVSTSTPAALIPAAPAPIMAIFRIYFSPFSLFCERKSSASAIISKAAFIFSSISAVFAAISERRM